MNDPLVVIILLNYNGLKHLEYCVPSILSTDYSNYELLVVDNCSSDESVPYLKKSYPDVKIIQNTSNLGWAGGNNVGLKYAYSINASYVVLANNDIKVHNLWLRAAVDAFSQNSEAIFVGCKVFGAIRKEPIEKFENACKLFKRIEISAFKGYIDGLALFANLNLLKNIGTIDEAYFAYNEEIDLQNRAKKAGYKSFITNVPVWHYSSGSFSKIKLFAAYLAIRNNIRMAIKQYSFIQAIKIIVSIYIKGCNPFFKGDMNNVVNARFRPKGVVFNFVLITYCLLWNIVKLPFTIMRRFADEKLIKETLKKRMQNTNCT